MNRKPLYLVLGVIIVLVVLRYTVLRDSGAPVVVAANDSVPAAERRLETARRAAAALPARQELYKRAAAELERREKNLLPAASQQQAEAALLQKVQDLAAASQIDVRGNQGFREKALTPDYGEVTVSVVFICGAEQLVNLLTSIAGQPEMLTTDEVHVAATGDKKKNLQVRLSVSTAVPRKILAEKKGVAAF